jgi:predicted NAD-dependent protein-ADP-ribosyltransferase YbiA (DUF1768 family)
MKTRLHWEKKGDTIYVYETDREFFDKAFFNELAQEPYKIPADLRRASERICLAYGIRGICDPMYIANVIAAEIGRGDGRSNFFD